MMDIFVIVGGFAVNAGLVMVMVLVRRDIARCKREVERGLLRILMAERRLLYVKGLRPREPEDRE